jgi:outer membrane protein insertion porin family
VNRPTVLALVALLFSSRATAQTIEITALTTEPVVSASEISGPIVSVRIEPPFLNEDSWQRVDVTRGEMFSAARAREALRYALSSDTFASATLSARSVDGGVELVIRGERRFRFVNIEVQGASARDPDLVREDADLRPDMVATEADIQDAIRKVVEAYKDNGYPDATCTVAWRETAQPGARVVVLQVHEGDARRIRDIIILGVDATTREILRDALSLDRGDVATPREIRTADEAIVSRLRGLGYLSANVSTEVETATGSITLRYIVSLGPRYVMRWSGVRALPEASLVEALRLHEEQGFSESTLASFASRVQEFYVSRGWFDAHVQVSLARDTPEERTVLFEVVERRQVRVRTIRFEGATIFNERELTTMVEEVARNDLPSTPRPIRGVVLRARTYTPGVYASAVQRIVESYQQRGYLDATILTPVTERVETPEGPRFDVTFRIHEGPRTFVEELVFEGNLAHPSAALAEAWGLPLGVPLSHRELGEARVRLSDWYREQGYAFARVDPDVERSPDHTRARVRAVVHEGPQVVIGRVEIRGNAVTRESVLRARLALREGSPFSLSAIRASQQQLYELGVFASVNVGIDDSDIEAPVKTLLVRVVEDRRFRAEMRFGISYGQGARVGFELGYLNLFGVGANLSVHPEVGYGSRLGHRAVVWTHTCFHFVSTHPWFGSALCWFV